MTLEEALVARIDDVHALVTALCALARRQLPRVAAIEPLNAAIVEDAERWLRGEASDDEMRDVWRRAQHTRGAVFTTACVAAIVDEATREDTVRFFAKQLPVALWMASADGKAWSAMSGPMALVGRDASAWAAVMKLDEELAASIS